MIKKFEIHFLLFSQRYFEQIVAGLESIHNAGVVHRDMKPGNMILTNEEKVKIIDFGSAEVNFCFLELKNFLT